MNLTTVALRLSSKKRSTVIWLFNIIKIELKKIGISFLITTFLIFYYNTDRLRNNFLYGLNTTLFGMFESFQILLFALLIYFLSYLIFNLFYLTIYYVLKFFNSKKSTIKITTLFIISLCSLYVINDQLIFYSVKEFKRIHHFTVNSPTQIDVDSTNFNKYEWSKKAIEMTSPLQTIEEKLIFNSDSTLTLIGRKIILDKFYIFRRLFDINKTYKVTRKYEYINRRKEFVLIDSTNSSYSIQVKDNRLYLNKIFFLSQ